jgi:hypothetical protein
MRRGRDSSTRRPLVAAVFLAAVAGGPRLAHADEAPTFADRDQPRSEGRDRAFALLLSPVSMVYGTFGGEADFVVTAAVVATVEVDAVHLPSQGKGANALSAGTSWILYPSGSALHGLSVSARVAFARPLREPELHVDWNTDVVECGVGVGWQWTWDYGLSVRVGAGPVLAVGGPPPLMSPELVAGRFRLAAAADAAIGWAFSL